jgi:hypothetical protein
VAPLYRIPQIGKFSETGSKLFARVRGEEEMTAGENGVSFWVDENV